MNNSVLEIEATDLGTFLGWLSNRLCKEGNSLQALAEMWFDNKSEEQNTIREFGVTINDMGQMLLALRKQLCQPCMLKQVKTTIHFPDNSTSEKKETGES